MSAANGNSVSMRVSHAEQESRLITSSPPQIGQSVAIDLAKGNPLLKFNVYIE
jgi:hypothetical protein